MGFGERVRLRRIGQRIGLGDFAQRLGISPAYWNSVEREFEIPSPDLLERAEDILGVKLDDSFVEAGLLQTDRGNQRARPRQHMGNSSLIDQTENVLRFPNDTDRSIENEGDNALNLVDHTDELIRGIEDFAVSLKARARSFAEGASNKLQHATNQIRSLETERRAAKALIQDAARSLQLAKSRIASLADQLSQAELRATTAEAQASKAEKSLNSIEDGIAHLLEQKGLNRQSPVGRRYTSFTSDWKLDLHGDDGDRPRRTERPDRQDSQDHARG